MALRKLQIFAFGSLLFWGLFLLPLSVDSLPILSTAIVIILPVFVVSSAFLACRAYLPPFSLSPYFFGSLFVFFCIGIVFWPIASFSPFEFNSLVSLQIDPPLMANAICLLGVSLSTTLLAYGVTAQRVAQTKLLHIEEQSMPAKNNRSLAKFGLLMMYVALPIVAYRLYQELSFILEAGYLALYTEGAGAADAPSWVLPFNYLFYTGFGLVCAFGECRRQFITAMMMFLAVSLVDGMKGARGAVIVPILFCWWFYSSQFQVEFRMGRIFGYGVVGFAIFMGVTFSRDNDTIEGQAAQFVVDSIATQGRSLQLTAIYLQEKEEIAQYGNMMVTSNLMIPIHVIQHPELRDVPQSIDQVMYSNNLKHILTYTLNPGYYFSGGGTGGVYLIELIESGPILFLILSASLGWFLAKWPSLMRRPYWKFMAFQVFSTLFYMPRAEFFPNSLNFLKSTIIYFAVVIFLRSFNSLRLRSRTVGELTA